MSTDTMTTTNPWSRTLAGRPAEGSVAERSRQTGMRDVEMFTEMNRPGFAGGWWA